MDVSLCAIHRSIFAHGQNAGSKPKPDAIVPYKQTSGHFFQDVADIKG